MEPIDGSEKSAFKTQDAGEIPKENILHKEHGESLKSRNVYAIQYQSYIPQTGSSSVAVKLCAHLLPHGQRR